MKKNGIPFFFHAPLRKKQHTRIHSSVPTERRRYWTMCGGIKIFFFLANESAPKKWGMEGRDLKEHK